MRQRGIYRITSIGRPLEPGYPTNRALLLLLPLAALFAAGARLALGDGAAAAASAAVSGLLVTFGAWALTRELVPDDEPAAFVSAALALAALLVAGTESLLPLFAALLLVRIVNRSTGLAPRPLDSLLVLAMALWTARSMQQPLLAGVAALAFALDATLPGGRRLQLLPAVICAAAFVVFGMRENLSLGLPASGPVAALAIVCTGALFLALITATSRVRSHGDVGPPDSAGPQPLSLPRVRAGMAIGLLAAIQPLLAEGARQRLDVVLWACLAGAVLGQLLQALRRLPRGGIGRHG